LLLWARRQEISIDSGWWRVRSSSGATARAAARRSAANASSVRFIADVGGLTQTCVLWKKRVIQTRLSLNILLTAVCPSGFTYLASVKGCYSLVKENLEWGVAGLQCKSLHPKAHLVIINDAEEQLAVKTWMSGYTGMHIRFVILYKSCMLYRADGEICLRPSCTYRPIGLQAAEANSSGQNSPSPHNSKTLMNGFLLNLECDWSLPYAV